MSQHDSTTRRVFLAVTPILNRFRFEVNEWRSDIRRLREFELTLYGQAPPLPIPDPLEGVKISFSERLLVQMRGRRKHPQPNLRESERLECV